MTKEQMNQLRPGQSVVYTVSTTRTKGRVLSVWRDDVISVKWSDGSKDTLMIDDDTAKHLSTS